MKAPPLTHGSVIETSPCVASAPPKPKSKTSPFTPTTHKPNCSHTERTDFYEQQKTHRGDTQAINTLPARHPPSSFSSHITPPHTKHAQKSLTHRNGSFTRSAHAPKPTSFSSRITPSPSSHNTAKPNSSSSRTRSAPTPHAPNTHRRKHRSKAPPKWTLTRGRLSHPTQPIRDAPLVSVGSSALRSQPTHPSTLRRRPKNTLRSPTPPKKKPP